MVNATIIKKIKPIDNYKEFSYWARVTYTVTYSVHDQHFINIQQCARLKGNDISDIHGVDICRCL